MIEEQNSASVPDDKKPKDGEKSAKSGFIQKLSEYREFIVILIFFIGGFLWIYEYFATRSQVGELNCLLRENINVVDGQMQTKFILESMKKNGLRYEKLLKLKEDNKLTLSEQEELIELKNEAKLLDEQLKKEQEKFRNSWQLLKANGCKNKNNY